jgi:hypothetical protein
MRRLVVTLGAAAILGLLAGCEDYCGPYGDQPCYGPYYGYYGYGYGPYYGRGPYYGGTYYGPGPHGPGPYYGPGAYYGGANLNAFYDSFYGPFYEGYWGPGGVFYYRRGPNDVYHRDTGAHFRHQTAPGYHAVHGGAKTP